MNPYRTIEWQDGVVRMLDQRLLPLDVKYLDFNDYHEVAWAIQVMVIRGAPAIGAAAAYGLALATQHSHANSLSEARQELEEAAQVLRASRPTAVNLFWAVDRVLRRAYLADSLAELRRAVLEEALAVEEEDARTNRQIGLNALPLVPSKAIFIHHCNTGALATTDYGTALGVIRAAHEHGRDVFVYVDETRPRLQGARLTAWELTQLGIPYAIIVDGASGFTMKTKGVNLVTVGCDRIARNGDTANKIGTYNLAIVAKTHGIPTYVVGPTSTIDLSISSGAEIKIEERDPCEVTEIGVERLAPPDAQVYNPAFDLTPAEFITAIITEEGIANPPFTDSLPELVARAEKRRKSLTH